jgi:tetratricopeptide (TPR) repeat protein
MSGDELTKDISLQTILKRRQREVFVGRNDKLVLFDNNLTLSLRDNRRSFIFDIFGQGGVGKTWLIRHFRQLAELSGALVATSDELQADVPSMMGHIAFQLSQQGYALESFAQRYAVYRQRRLELESDPEAPQGLPGFVGRSIGRTTIHLARRIPFAGAVFEVIDEDTFATQASEWATYIARKIRNKDDVHLLKEPIDVLTPLFVEGIRAAAEEHLLALFFDTYERTGEYLETWLLELLEQGYGEVPANIVLTISGREELDPNNWSPYDGILARLPLEPFTEDETVEYLLRKGIKDDRVIDVIARLSGRLPLLVATLAAESPADPQHVGDPSGPAVERFLKWVEDPKRRQVALDASLPRKLNLDVLRILTSDEDSDSFFEWLKTMPFLEDRPDARGYHEVVRAQMLRHKRRDSPQQWSDLHGRLAEYYHAKLDALGLNNKERYLNPTWQSIALEHLYHSACRAPHDYLIVSLNDFVAALESQRSFARRWAESIHQAGVDCGNDEIQDWGQSLLDGLKGYDEFQFEVTTSMLTALLEYTHLDKKWSPVVLNQRGYLLYEMKKLDESLADLNQAIELVSDNTEYFVNRGKVHKEMKSYNEALEDFRQAIELDQNNLDALISRGLTSLLVGSYDAALRDIGKALDAQPDDPRLLLMKLAVLVQLGDVTELSGTLKVLGRLSPKIAEDLKTGLQGESLDTLHRKLMYRTGPELSTNAVDGMIAFASEIQRIDQAVLSRAIEVVCEGIAETPPAIIQTLLRVVPNAWIKNEVFKDLLAPFAIRAGSNRDIYGQIVRRVIEALSEMPPSTIRYLLQMVTGMPPSEIAGQMLFTYQRMLKASDNEILGALNSAFESEPDFEMQGRMDHARRGELLRSQGLYEDALREFDCALQQGERVSDGVLNSRGLTLSYLERYSEAIEEYDQLLAKSPEDFAFLYNKAVAMARWKGVSGAQSEIQSARDAVSKLLNTDPNGAELYGLGGLEALEGNADKALDYLERAIAVEERAVDWARHDMAWLQLRDDARFQSLMFLSSIEELS